MGSRRVAGRAAALVMLAGIALGTGSPAQGAGRWVTQQRVTDAVGDVGLTDVASSAAGGAATIYTVTAPASQAGVYVATRAPGAVPTATAARGFSDGQRIVDASKVRQVHVVVDDLGGTTAVWVLTRFVETGNDEPDERDGDIQSAYRPAGGVWGPVQSFGPAPEGSGAPAVAARPGGGAILLGGFWVATRIPGAAAFSPKVPLTEIGQGTWHPAFAQTVASMNSRGDIAVAYHVNSYDTDPDLFLSILPAGKTWTRPELVGESLRGDVFDPSARIALTESGRVVVAWQWRTSGAVTVKRRFWTPFLPSSYDYGEWSEVLDLQTRSVGDEPLLGLRTVARNAATLLYRDTIYPEGTRYIYEFRIPGNSGVPQTGLTPPDDSAWDLTYDDAWDENASGWKVGLPHNGPAGTITARVKNAPGVKWSPLATVISPATAPAKSYGDPHVALDDEGNGFVSWVRTIAGTGGEPDTELVGVTGYDPVNPVLAAPSIPATATAGTAAALSAAATDRMSKVTITWDFGDGATATGPAVKHTWAAAGTYAVVVKATDEARNVTTRTGSIIVGQGRVDVRPWLYASVLPGGETLVRSVSLYGVQSGDGVALSCTGTGCDDTANRTLTAPAAAATLTTRLGPEGAGLTLAPGAVLTAVISRSGVIAQTVRWTMAPGRAPIKR